MTFGCDKIRVIWEIRDEEAEAQWLL